MQPPTIANKIKAKIFTKFHLGSSDLFNEEGWDKLIALGYYPISIKAAPEGTVVNTQNVLMTIENTHPDFYWLTNWIETLGVQLWYPCTVAAQSRYMKRILQSALEKSGDPRLIDFKLHDFGYRGSTSDESAGIGAAAHLLNFRGTDTIAGIDLLNKYYTPDYPGDNCTNEKIWEDYYEKWMPGFSIPASEHSTITSWGQENELAAMGNMLTQFPSGLVACVSDSYDIFRACEIYWGNFLHDQIMERDGCLVIRPDSSSDEYPITTLLPKLLDILGERFGYTLNAKGYKVLDPHVRMLQGDGVDKDSLSSMLNAIMNSGWSADNIAFGSGGGLLQKVNRDTCKFAFKCSSISQGGLYKDVFKLPITDSGKNSKRGRFALGYTGVENNYITIPDENYKHNILQPVFLNGRLLINENYKTIRKRIN